MKDKQSNYQQRVERILKEPATGSRGQGGLPFTGSVVDYEIRYTKEGRKFLVGQLTQLIDQARKEAFEQAWDDSRELASKYTNQAIAEELERMQLIDFSEDYEPGELEGMNLDDYLELRINQLKGQDHE